EEFQPQLDDGQLTAIAGRQIPDLDASSAPCTSERSFAPEICGWVRPTQPQSVPAITFAGPTRLAKRRMRCATSSGCSMPSVACETSHGIRILPGGSFT